MRGREEGKKKRRKTSTREMRKSRGGMETERISKLKKEPHLSGAYIRSLVKQLSSSRTNNPMNPKDPDRVDGDGFPQYLTKFSGDSAETQQPNEPQQLQKPKKQVRRRLHTSRPYQERLLNMAEARREIVTALKFHRASMKQANEQQQQSLQQQPSQTLQPPSHPSLEHEEEINSWRNPRIYPSNTTSYSNYEENLAYSSFSCPPNHFSFASSPVAPQPITENINFTLPNQTLGLNLNFHDFNNVENQLFYSSSSSSPTLSNMDEVPSTAISPEEPPMMEIATDSGGITGGLHPAMGDEEMAEIRSIGEKHQMEWNDTLNLVTSARWFKFLKTMETTPERKEETGEDDGFHPFDELMEFPSWLNANESCLLQQHLEDYCSEDYSQDPVLPCMDIGEIDGMDSEWLV